MTGFPRECIQVTGFIAHPEFICISRPVPREIFGQNRCFQVRPVYMLTSSFGFLDWIEVDSIDSSRMLGNSPEILNFNRFFLKLHRFICDWWPAFSVNSYRWGGGGGYSVTFLHLITRFELHMVWCGSKNKHHKRHMFEADWITFSDFINYSILIVRVDTTRTCVFSLKNQQTCALDNHN